MDPDVCAAISAAYFIIIRKKRKRERRMWMREYFKHERHTIIRDLRSDHELFKNFTRMSPDDFSLLLEVVRGQISKQNTVMRNAIPAEIRLAITLRYLATGDSYPSLSFMFHVSKQSISEIIPETARSIKEVLQDYIKVGRFSKLFIYFLIIYI